MEITSDRQHRPGPWPYEGRAVEQVVSWQIDVRTALIQRRVGDLLHLWGNGKAVLHQPGRHRSYISSPACREWHTKG